MSRTTRRKNPHDHYRWVLSDYVWAEGRYLREIQIDPHSAEGKKKLARYHSDAGFGEYGSMTAPHWYRRQRNKKATNLEKLYLRIWLRLGDDRYEVPKPVRVRDASWYW